MSLPSFVLALVRLAVLVGPVPLAVAYLLRLRTGLRGVDAALADVVVSLAVVAVAAELLGLFGALRFGWLAGLLWLLAVGAVVSARAQTGRVSASARLAGDGSLGQAGLWCLVALIGVVVAQWILQTADSLGGGMFSFDVLWYHMPFAAAIAQSGSVTRILFTQADPWVAYFPATSELFHALGIIAIGNDVLSPLLNLGWMALALLAGWSIGWRWEVQRQTLATVAMLLALPVFSVTQPGQAFNDIVGVATLLAAVALLAAESREPVRLLAAGCALGLAIGTKYTFVVPALVLVIGVAATSRRQRAGRALLVAGAAVVTGGWWYLRATIHTGNPLGIRSSLGPITLPGPASPLADASQQTVISQLAHTDLWLSRFAPGLAHAFGVLWPVVVLAWLAVVVVVVVALRDSFLRTLAIAAILSGITYLVLPTGATAISRTSQLFAVNLRYVVPALALGLVMLPMVVQARAPALAPGVLPAALLIAVVAQLEPAVWPSQTGRHIAFLAGTLIILVLAVDLLGHNRELGIDRVWRSGAATVAIAAVAVVGGGFFVQRHYLRVRYRAGDVSSPALGAIYGWAQTVKHTRIALYGTVQQYPLYGATADNHVTYLGRRTARGGYQPIPTCPAWQRALRAGRYRYLVLTVPAPTTAIPLSWSTDDPALKLVLHPGPDAWVFQISPTGARISCA